MKTTFWFWNQIKVIWSIFFYEWKIKKFCLLNLARYSWIENSRAARGFKIWKYIVFLIKTIVLLSDFKKILWFLTFSTMSENIFSELQTGPQILNLKFNWGIILLLILFYLGYYELLLYDIYMKTTVWFWIWIQIRVIWSIFLYESWMENKKILTAEFGYS